ncbi:hypothetical protein [Alkalihalophilus marmarensis]|uniref:hypothetical protein n=1 Tax=Alkalihalophilus marmarensis TaxID=521377 RepID=UPI002E1C8A36|nr:hypothetical protein [Alkalihalophilus marmarensis]
MRKRTILLTVCAAALVVGLFLSIYGKPNYLRETLITFPIDPNATYTEASSNLEFLQSTDEDEYKLRWDTLSVLNEEAAIRQDVSLLFEDGVLKDTMSKWEENTELLAQQKEVSAEDSGHYEVITFHHAELRRPNNQFRSAQAISFDQLYVIDSPLSPLHAFKIPETAEDKESKRILDYILEQQQTYDWDDLFEYYQIPSSQYRRIPLTKIDTYQSESIPGLTMEETTKFLGGLWEGLYKNYVLGIDLNGTAVSPIGSTVPLIVIPKENPDHVFILFRTADDTPIQLMQSIPAAE